VLTLADISILKREKVQKPHEVKSVYLNIVDAQQRSLRLSYVITYICMYVKAESK